MGLLKCKMYTKKSNETKIKTQNKHKFIQKAQQDGRTNKIKTNLGAGWAVRYKLTIRNNDSSKNGQVLWIKRWHER
jgi:hypothetical protein